jgi:protein translocase SecG subunit
MEQLFLIIQLITATALIFLILVQSKGSGLGRAWGGGGGTSFTRRGLEKIMFKSTFAIAAIFIIFSLFRILI